MEEAFGVAAFRSRQQVLRFDQALRRAGIASKVISTPRDVAIGCGLSVRFEIADLSQVLGVLDQVRPGNLIGIYRVDRMQGMRSQLTAITSRPWQ